MDESDAVDDPEGRAGRQLSWRTWVFVVLAVGWAIVAIVSSRDRGPAWGFAALAAALALVNINRDRRRRPTS